MVLVCGYGVGGASAEVYRSLDANGRPVFADKPPSGLVRSEGSAEVRTPGVVPAGSDWQEQERAFRIRAIDRAAAESREKRERDQRCDQARKREAGLAQSDGVTLFRVSPSGERVFISDQERQEMARQQRQSVEQFCRR